MKYTPREIMEFVEQEDVKFIRLAFCNVYGKQHNVAIMPGELSRPSPTESPSTPPPSRASAARYGPTCCCGRIPPP